MRRRVNVRGIIINNKGEIFCQKLTANTGKGRDFWCTPGGGLEMGESLLGGLRREMIEETGVKPEIGKLLFIQQFAESDEQSAHGPNEQLEFFFLITNWQDYQHINLEQTSHGVEEVAECGFVDPKTTRILPSYLTEVNLDWLINNSTETQILSEL
jgi:8-oxo-dGTP diphosphatase